MMADGFLTIVKRALGDGDYAGDQNGGARGADGSGLPTGNPGNFMFATGSSAPTSRSTRAGLAVKGIMIHQDHGSGCLARTAITMISWDGAEAVVLHANQGRRPQRG
jgi:hypothetical protein